MAADPTDGAVARPSGAGSASAAFANVSVLEQTLWRNLVEGGSPEQVAASWLALQCRVIPDVRRAVLVLRRESDERNVPAAYWPEGDTGSPLLSIAAEQALARRVPVIHGRGRGAADSRAPRGGDAVAVALPLIVEETTYAVVAVEIPDRPESELRQVIRQVQWGVAWLESMVRRQLAAGERLVHERTRAALDALAPAIESDTFDEACLATVTELAHHLDCERVSIGFRDRRHTAVTAISHSAQFGRRMDLIRSLGAAMDEAIDQHDIVLSPPIRDDEISISHAHAQLVRNHGIGHVLTIPIAWRERELGAVTFERDEATPFDQETLDLAECVVAFVGPVLDERRRNALTLPVKILQAAELQFRRLVGSQFVGRKLAFAVLVLVTVFFIFAKGDYRVTAPIVLEGEVQRAVVAAFDSHVQSQYARAGDSVKAGQLLAKLSDRDLVLQRSGLVATRSQALKEYDKALADHDRAQAAIDKAKIDQAVAQIQLVDAQLARTELRAPFDGLVVSGDLSQSVGAAVQRGQMLFEVAPLNSYRVILKVDEADIAGVAPGKKGAILVSSQPDTLYPVTVTAVTPITEAREGKNRFRVEAKLDEPGPELRPGMEGIGKIMIDRRRLISIWTRKLVNWARLTMWRFTP